MHRSPTSPAPTPRGRHLTPLAILLMTCLPCLADTVKVLPVAADEFDASARIEPRTLMLARPLTGPFTIEAWIQLDRPASDGTVAVLSDGTSPEPVAKLTLRDGKLRLAQRGGSTWRDVDGTAPLPAHQWVHVAAMQELGALTVFLDGKLDGSRTRNFSDTPADRLVIGAAGSDGPAVRIRSVRVFPSPLSDEAVARLARADSLSAAAADADKTGLPLRIPQVPSDEHTRYHDLMLRVSPEVAQPLSAGLLARFVMVPARPGELPGLMAYSRAFGAVRTYFPGAKLENAKNAADTAAPLTFQAGQFLPRHTVWGATTHEPMFPCVNEGAGGFVSAVRNPATGITELVFLGCTAPDAPNPLDFRDDPQPIPCGPEGKPMGLAYRGYSLNYFGDVDQDGTPDLVLTRSESTGSYYPDHPKNFWTGEDLPNSGPGKGYTVNGRWLGSENLMSFHWARGERTPDGKLRLGTLKPVIQGDKEYPLRWKGFFGTCSAGMMIGGKPHLIVFGDLDRALAMPVTVRDGVLHCGKARDLLAPDGPNGARLHQCYIPSAVVVGDIDNDGKQESILCGNPGSCAILSGDAVGNFRERQLFTTGGPLAMQSLVVQARGDWDADGKPDLVAGDSSGWLMFWPGTNSFTLYGKPEYFRLNGTPIHIQAGYGGSIQGPNEARWGYVNPTLCDWDGDGTLEIITCDINADLLLWRRGSSPLDLQPPERFSMNGEPLAVAWRQRVAFVPGSDHLAGDERPCLLIQDWDGHLALAVPTAKGAASIERIEKLHYQDGQPILTCGPTGCWGRSKFVWIDWDGDGVKDVLYSTNRASNKFIIEQDIGKRSTPLFLKNVGTTSKPVFARPVPLKYLGELIDFGTHISAVWPLEGTDAIHGGLFIGGEDGRVYFFRRKDLKP